MLYYLLITHLFIILNRLTKPILCNETGEPPVIEMDDRIIDFTKMGRWLITFYAPWCGHCKKLEPVFEEVGNYYLGKGLNVARIDATRFLKATNHFEIKAYPTIKYVYGKTKVNFGGERRKEDLIDFVEKVEAPRVGRVIHQLDFEHLKIQYKLFFLLITYHLNQTNPMINDFFQLAERYFLNAYFLFALPEYVAKTATVYVLPKIAVVKEQEIFFYENKDMPLEEFVRLEQFTTFTEVTMSNFQNLVETRKILLILLCKAENPEKTIDAKYGDEPIIKSPSRKFKQKIKIFSKTMRNTFHNEFQFGFTENTDLINGIAIWTLPVPTLFVFNTTSYMYSLVELMDHKNRPIDLNIEKVLQNIRDQKLEFYGGQSWFRSVRRPFWELYRAIIDMFYEAPIISLLIFGFPLGVISVVCYFLCCLDSSDQGDSEDLSDSEGEDEHQYFLNEASRLHNLKKLESQAVGTERPLTELKIKEDTSKKQQ